MDFNWRNDKFYEILPGGGMAGLSGVECFRSPDNMMICGGANSRVASYENDLTEMNESFQHRVNSWRSD